MKRFLLFLSAIFLAVSLFAQDDTLAPGIYSVNGDEYEKLPFSVAGGGDSGVNVLGLELGKVQYFYKGAESGVKSTGSFVMVIDPEKKVVKGSMKDYNPFIKDMTPENIIIIPLEVKKKKRVYSEGLTVMGFNTERKARMSFTWERISDNSFRIETEPLVPGEYGIVLKFSKVGKYYYEYLFGFTVPAADSSEESEAAPSEEAEATPEEQ